MSSDYDVVYKIRLKEENGTLVEGKIMGIWSKNHKGGDLKKVDIEAWKAFRRTQNVNPKKPNGSPSRKMSGLDYLMRQDSDFVGLFEFHCPKDWTFQSPAFKFDDNDRWSDLGPNSGATASFTIKSFQEDVDIKYSLFLKNPKGCPVEIDPVVKNGSTHPFFE